MYALIFKAMTKWWLQIPLIYWMLGYGKKQNYFRKLVDDFTSDIVKRRQKALAEATPNEDCMGIVDRFILSGDLTEEEIKLETLTLFTTVRYDIIDT